MKLGNNTFSVLVENISSGSLISGLTNSDFTFSGIVGGVTYSAITMTETSTPGVYSGDLNLTATGRGFVKIDTASDSYKVTPPIEIIEVTSYSTDDVYNRLSVNFIDIDTNTGGSFVTSSLTTKEGDDTLFAVATGEILTGWSAFKSSLVYSNTVVASGSNYIGDLTVASVDTSAGIVTLEIPWNITDGIVPSGSSQIRLWGDLQAEDPSGKKKTLAEITYTIKRKFTI